MFSKTHAFSINPLPMDKQSENLDSSHFPREAKCKPVTVANHIVHMCLETGDDKNQTKPTRTKQKTGREALREKGSRVT